MDRLVQLYSILFRRTSETSIQKSAVLGTAKKLASGREPKLRWWTRGEFIHKLFSEIYTELMYRAEAEAEAEAKPITQSEIPYSIYYDCSKTWS